jgi:hypothetical protein
MNAPIQSTAPVGHGGMRPGGPPPGMRPAMDALADKLGVSADELGDRLKKGESLSDIATARGISRDDAIADIQRGRLVGGRERRGQLERPDGADVASAPGRRPGLILRGP